MIEIPKNAFCNIPLQVLFCPELTKPSLQLYGIISNLANMNGLCESGNDYFAKTLQVDKRTIIRALKQLEDRKFINVHWEGNRRKINLPFSNSYQAVDNFTCLAGKVTKGDLPSAVFETFWEIVEKQREKYPAMQVGGNKHGAANAEIILTLAKAIYKPEMIKVKLGSRKPTAQTLQDLLDVFDIGRVSNLAIALAEDFQNITNVDQYILASLFNAHENLIKYVELDRDTKDAIYSAKLNKTITNINEYFDFSGLAT